MGIKAEIIVINCLGSKSVRADAETAITKVTAFVISHYKERKLSKTFAVATN